MGDVVSINCNKRFSKNTAERIEIELQNCISDITRGLRDHTEFEKEFIIYTRLTKMLTYSNKEKATHSILAPVLNHKGSCDGRSKLLALCLRAVGISCIVVREDGHMWNMASIDGHMTIPHYEDEGLVWKILNEETAHLNMVPADPCLVSAEYLDDEFKEKDVELIAWKTVKGEYPDTEHVKFKTLPAVKVASCMVKGGYDQMPDVYGAVISWVTANGYECAGPMFNIYHVSPHETQNPDEFVTEVCYAVK